MSVRLRKEMSESGPTKRTFVMSTDHNEVFSSNPVSVSILYPKGLLFWSASSPPCVLRADR